MKDFCRGFTMGFLVPLRGWTLLRQSPPLQSLSLVPFLATGLVISVGGTMGFQYLLQWQEALCARYLESLLGPSSWLYTVLNVIGQIFYWPVSLAGLLYLLFVVSQFLVAPIYSLLAERVLIEQGALADQPFRVGSLIRTTVSMFLVSIKRTALLSLVGLIALVFSFIPGLNLIAALALLLVVAFDVADFSLEALQTGLKERFSFYFANFSVFLGMAGIIGLVFLIPGLNFLLFPITVVGTSEWIGSIGSKKGRVNGTRHHTQTNSKKLRPG